MVLAELLEAELTRVMNSGTSTWHQQIADITQAAGKLRLSLEEALK